MIFQFCYLNWVHFYKMHHILVLSEQFQFKARFVTIEVTPNTTRPLLNSACIPCRSWPCQDRSSVLPFKRSPTESKFFIFLCWRAKKISFYYTMPKMYGAFKHLGCQLSCSCTAEYYVSTQESEMKLYDTSSI